ncbi:MAG: LCP family protein [Treponema sp.]|nr:LCP family protein [Treponema sp.]
MKMSSDKKGVFFLVIIFAVIIGAGIFIGVSLRADPASDTLKSDEVIRTLLVISDGNGNALTSDVLFYYPESQKSALFNIPLNTGDIYSSLVGKDGREGRTDRIDAVYRECGFEAYAKEIGILLGKEIPFAIDISLEDFGKLTDLLGGFSVFVPSPVDGVSPDGERWLLPFGVVTLDGDKIQTYVTYRTEGEDDSDVVSRRQTAVMSMLTAIHAQRAALLDKKNFPLYAEKLHTDLTEKNLYKLISYLSNINVETDHLIPQTIQGSLRRLPSTGETVLFPLFEGQLIKDVVQQAEDSLIHEGGSSYRYVLQVLNGTTVKGSASNASILLNGLGNFDVLPAADADRNDYEHTVIINYMQSDTSEALTSLSNFITCKNIEHRPSSSLAGESNSDFTVILGKDWDGRYVRGGYVNPENLPQEETASEDGESAEGSGASESAEVTKTE